MSLARFERVLKEAMGLDSPSIGLSAIERAVRDRATACELSDLEAYALLVETSDAERQALVEAVVVPETWFFRDRGAFTALARLASANPPLFPRPAPLRLLSAPCSTGEEPYSIAMALLDAGLDASRFSIDAIDISGRALEHARRAVYRKNSFRGEDLSFRERYFDGERLDARVRDRVRFIQSNLFAAEPALTGARYDVVFCRNLLIYFDRHTQDRAVGVLTGLLATDGILFVGPSETGLLLSHGFESRNWPLAFAFRAPRKGGTEAGLPSVPRRAAARKTPPPSVQKKEASFSFLKSAPRVAVSTDLPAADAPLPFISELQQARQLADEGNIAAAKRRCEKILRDHGPLAEAHHLLGLLHDTAGETASATEHYRRALYLDPQHQETLVHLAVLMERTGDPDAAARLHERAKRAAAKATNP